MIPGAAGNLEVELKLALPPQQAERLRRHPALRPISPHRAVVADLDAIYFDTPDLALQARGIAVRLREAGGRWVQTVKGRGEASGALHQRQEWETPSEGAGLDFSGIDDLALRRQLCAPDIASRLRPVFRTRFRRWARLLVLADGSRIELALDQGRIEAGGHEQAISEIELELKQGRARTLFELALVLQHDLALVPEPRSKAERGYRLHSGAPETPARARAPRLDPGAPPEQAVAAFLGAGGEQLARNLEGSCNGGDDEFLHQARVALRRLRTTLGLFRDLLPQPDAARLAGELRWLTGETGAARDLDVLIGTTLAEVAAAFPDQSGLAELAAAAQARRVPAHQRVRSAFASPRCARLQLELGLLAAGLAETALHAAAAAPMPDAVSGLPAAGADDAPAGPPRRPRTLREFARRSLRRRGRRSLLERAELAGLDTEARHQWRISLKKLRYAGDFLAPVLAGPRGVRRWIGALSSLQDILGSLNDAATTDRLLAELDPGTPAAREAAALVRGWLTGAGRVRLEQLEAARRQLVRSRVPWKG